MDMQRIAVRPGLPRSSLVTPVHTLIPGRARLKVYNLYRNARLKQDLESSLASCAGIESFAASTLTGNVLVRYDAAKPVREILILVTAIVAGLPRPDRKQSGSTGASVPRKTRAARESVHTGKGDPVKDRRNTREGYRWHSIEARALLDEFAISPASGLSERTAKATLSQHGPNVLPEITPRSSLEVFFDQFRSLPVALLGASACLSLVTGGIVDAVVISAVISINAGIGYATEIQAERAISGLMQIAAQPARVVRDGVLTEIDPAEIVPGDILALLPGVSVPADARVIEARHLSVDESSLTGESLPATKKVSILTQDDVPLAERGNMIYRGTTVTAGSGFALVVATGRDTELGRIQALLGETRIPDTPMEKQLSALGNRLVLLSIPVCGAMFGIGLLRGYGPLELLKATIALGVAAIPEGLPTVATTTLALGLNEMRQRKVLIRHLDAVEALGAVQVMCLDKTGTLTANRMSVVSMLAGTRLWRGGNGRFWVGSEVADPSDAQDLTAMARIAVLCNDSEISGEPPRHSLRGSPTENALVELGYAFGIDVAALRAQYPRTHTVYRTETRHFMMTAHNAPDSYLVAVKGGPVEVLRLCRWWANDTCIGELTEEQRSEIAARNEEMAGNGLRVLGFACKQVDQVQEEIGDDLIWLGLAGMADPLREGMRDLIGDFHRAGIATVMITGDQSATAFAVGRELDLSGNTPLNIFDAARLDQVEPEVLGALASEIQVFARVSPAQKLKIVQALQRAGKVVAMTGDGINDGPALKMADVGVAMGLSGTEVARRVADIVLEEDDLAAMVSAISQGRTIYDNIRKAIRFLLSTNLSEVGVMLSSIGLGLGTPLNPIQLLWINLISDIFPGLALALEPAHPDVLERPPRDPDAPILGPGTFKRLGLEGATLAGSALLAYGYGRARHGPGARASSLAFMTLTSAQLLHALSCRSERHSLFGREKLPPNRYLNAALGASFSVQALAGILPGWRRLLGLAPLSGFDYLVVGAGAVLPLLANEASKTFSKEECDAHHLPHKTRVLT